jgi:chemotaxis protein methyltransferase CheR
MIDLAPFIDLVRQRCGLDFGNGDRLRLERALDQRMSATGLAAGAGYFVHLLSCEQEFAALVSLLTINETYFFREPQHLTLMVERLVPRLLARPGRDGTVRILSAGCSTGEEPYSIAIALRERYGDAAESRFEITGSDIDRQALARARSGRYGAYSFRGREAGFRERYFLPAGDGWVLRPDLRRSVRFVAENLLEPLPPASGDDYDLIFLRNVSIYFDEPTRRDLHRRLCARLKPGGCLLVGLTETMGHDFGLMSLIQEDGLFYFVRRPPAATPAYPPPPLSPPWPPAAAPVPAAMPAPVPAPPPETAPPEAPPPEAQAPEAPTLDEAECLTWERRYEPALALLARLDREPSDPERRLRSTLLKGYILLNRGDLAGAEAEARRALELESWSIDAFLILGLAARHGADPDQARDWLRRAVYASHGCWPAHYYIADLHRSTGHPEKARVSYRVVLNLLTSPASFDTGLKILLPAFPASDIRFLCQHHLAVMEGNPSLTSRPRVRS